MTLVRPEEHFVHEENVLARFVGDIGWGLFAETDFEVGDSILWLDVLNDPRGKIEHWHNSFGDGFVDRSYTIVPGFGWGTNDAHPFWYINHSCSANCGFKDWGRIQESGVPIVAYRRIARGEQIMLNYGLFTTAYDGGPDGRTWTMNPCLCGMPDCKGFAVGFDRMPPELQMQELLPDGPVTGRALAHILPSVPAALSALRLAAPSLFQQYLDVLQEQLATSNALYSRCKLPT